VLWPAFESGVCLKRGHRGDAGETPPVLRSRNFAGRAACRTSPAGNATLEHYDPFDPADLKEWLDMDESQRVHLPEDFHRRAGIRPPNARMHAIFHVIVENQAALGGEIPVRGTLERLMGEGLDRHEAIHVIASVLSGHVFDIARGKPARPDANAAYFAALGKLTVESWRRNYR
jgi:hypothetical protein